MGLQNGSLDASKLIQNTDVLEKKLEPVVDRLGEVIDKIDQLDGKKAKASVEIDTRDSSKDLNEVKHEFEELLKTIKAPNQKKNYFQSIENSAKDLKKAWRDLVNEAGKGTFTEAEKYDNQYATTVLRCANAFEALKGNIKEVSPEISEFVQGMRQIEKYSDERGYNFTVKGFEQAFEVFAKMKEVGATYNGFDFSKGFTEVKQDILELSSLTSIWGQSSSSASEQAFEAYEELGNVAEEAAKKIEKLTEAEMERKLKSEHEKGYVSEWDIDLDDELSDIEKYSKALDTLKQKQKEALSDATMYQNDWVKYGDQYDDEGSMIQQIELYHKYADQIEFVQKRLQEAIRDYTPNAVGETGQELNALIIILRDLHEEILKISSAFANVDETSGIGALIKSINEMSIALSEAIVKVGDLGEAFAGKDFSININAGNNSNPIDRQRKIGRSSRETIDTLRKSFDALSDELLGGTTTNLFQGLGKQFKDFYEVSARMNPDSDSLDATIYNYQKLISILKEAANIKGIDISEWSNSFEKASLEAVDATNRIIDGEEETEKAANKLFDLFGNANKVDLSGMTVQLDGVVQELRAIAELVEKGFTVNDILNGKTTDTGEEVKGLVAVKETVDSITKSVNDKTESFEKEAAKVAQIVPMETGYLGKLISALKIINEQLENMGQFTGIDLSKINIPDLSFIQLSVSDNKTKLENDKTHLSSNIIDDILPSNKDFDDILKNLDLTKSELEEIVKIKRQAHADKDGKFFESFVLTDRAGSTETYGESSDTSKGQLLSYNYVEKDVKAEEHAMKELLAVQKQITKETDQQTKAQQKKWQSFYKEQQDYLSGQYESDAIERNNKTYQELVDTIQQYGEVKKRIAGKNALEGDIKLAERLETKISQLQQEPILSSSQIDESDRKLEKIFNQLVVIEKKTAEKNNAKFYSDWDDAIRINEELDKANKYSEDYVYSIQQAIEYEKQEKEYIKERNRLLAEGKKQAENYRRDQEVLKKQEQSSISKRTDTSYNKELKLEREINKLKIKNISASEEDIAYNNVLISRKEELIKKERSYRAIMGLVSDNKEAELINKKATLTQELIVAQDAYNAKLEETKKKERQEYIEWYSSAMDKKDYTDRQKSEKENESFLRKEQGYSDWWNKALDKKVVQDKIDATKQNNKATKAYDKLFKSAKKYYELKQKEATGSLLDEEIKLLDDLKKEWDDAYQAKGRYAGNTNGDSVSLERLNNTKQNFIDNNLSAYQTSVKKFASDTQNALDKIKLNKKNFQYGDQYYKLIDKLQIRIDELNSKGLDIVTQDELKEVNSLQTDITILLNTIKNQTKNLDFQLADPEKTYQQMAKIKQIINDNTAMPRALRESFEALNKKYQLVIDTKGSQNNLEELNIEFNKLNYRLQASGKTGNSVFTSLGKKIKNMSQNYIAMYFSLYDIMRYARQGFETIKEYDTALTEMIKVSKESISTLKEFQKESFGLADAIGTTAKQLQNSTADWMRLGESLEQAKQSAQDANILFNVSEFESIDEATESLVSMSQAYKELGKGEIIDVVNNLGNNFAISTDGLATALQNSASALKTAQNDFFEAAALTTAANTVVQDPDKVGAGLRTIALRLTGTEAAREELAALGEDIDDFVVTTTSKLDQQIKDLTKTQGNFGVSLLDMNGNYRSTYEVLLDIAKVWDKIAQEDLVTGENRQNALLEMMAGKNRSNILASVLQSPEVLEKAYAYALDSEGSAMRENEAYLESIEAHLSQLKNAWDSLWVNENNREVITFFLDLAKAVLETVNEFGVLKTFLVGGGGIFAAFQSIQGKGRLKKLSLIFI